MDPQEVRQHNEDLLRQTGLEPDPALPPIPAPSEVQLRSAEEIAARAFALANFLGIAHTDRRDMLVAALKEYGLWDFLSFSEIGILTAAEVTAQQKADAFFLGEALNVLAWCIGRAPLDHFRHCPDGISDIFPPMADPRSGIERYVRRPVEDIQKQADLLYRLHMIALDGKLGEREIDNHLVILENRRRAIDWVYGVATEWDAISFDS